MTTLEDRLRDELHQLAARAQPDSIRLLRGRRPGPGRPARLPAPLAAAAAVAAVAVAIAVVAPGSPQPGVSPAPAAAPAPAGAAIPRYYAVAYQTLTDGGRKIATYAAVHSSATGATTGRVALPTLTGTGSSGGAFSPAISAAADGRTFVVMESRWTSIDDAVWLFRLRVSGSGAVRVTRLPESVPPSWGIQQMALSPDGTRLAMTAQWGCGNSRCQHTGIRVVTLATGAVTLWSTHVNGAPFNVSWADAHSVAFEWQPDARTPAPGYRVLPLSAPGDLLAASTPVASPRAEPDGYVPAALLTPDGTSVVTSQVVPYARGQARGATARIVELNARTGRLERTLYTASTAGDATDLSQACNVLSLGPGSTPPLVSCFARLGALSGGRIVPLPGLPGQVTSGAPPTTLTGPGGALPGQAVAW